MGTPYLHYDVFTSEALAGNQLAVFLDGRGFAPERMQALAREMGFSESTFILPAERPDTDVRMRIFTPAVELPMAGHPTIGSTFALAHAGTIAPGTGRFVFGLGIGPTPVALEWGPSTSSGHGPSAGSGQGQRLRFAWMTQQPPVFGPIVRDVQAVAAALGVRRDDLAGDLPVQQVSCGLPFLFVPLASRAAVDRAVSEASAIRRLSQTTGLDLGLFLFTLDGGNPDRGDARREASSPAVTVYSRMFAPQFGMAEDPATGSASGPLGCYLVHYGLVTGDAAQRILSLQGVAMRRPSYIHIRIGGSRERITNVEIGGEAVLVAQGDLVI